MKNILLIEDKTPEYEKYQKILEKNNDINVYPKVVRTDIDTDLDTKVGVITTLRGKNQDEAFQAVYDHYKTKNIDLYIIDVSLNARDDIGLKFLGFLQKKGVENFIILSGASFEALIDQNEIDLNKDADYVYKGQISKLTRLVKIKLGISHKEEEDESEKWFIQEWERFKNDGPKYWLHLGISFALGLMIVATLVYAINGILCKDMCKGEYDDVPIDDMIVDTLYISISNIVFVDSTFNRIKYNASDSDTNFGILKPNNKKESSKLVFIEHIFLYFLPLFIVLGFYEYYRQTIGVLLRGGSSFDYRPEKAMVSLRNSKTILLTSILSFSLIKTIELIFENSETNVVKLSSYGIFIIILMIYIYLQHTQSNKNNGDEF